MRIHKRPRSRNDGEPLAHLLGNLGGALRTGKLQSQASLGGRVVGSDFDQQFGQSLGAEGFEVFRVKRCFCGHSLFSRCEREKDSLVSDTPPVKHDVGAAMLAPDLRDARQRPLAA